MLRIALCFILKETGLSVSWITAWAMKGWDKGNGLIARNASRAKLHPEALVFLI